MEQDSSALLLCPYQNEEVVQAQRGGEGKRRKLAMEILYSG